MHLSDYLSMPDQSAKALANRLGKARQYLHRIAAGKQKPSPKLARQIEETTGGAVTKEELRPDIWSPSETERAA